MTREELTGLKKAAIVLKALADSLTSPTAQIETLALVRCVIKAANEIEQRGIQNGEL